MTFCLQEALHATLKDTIAQLILRATTNQIWKSRLRKWSLSILQKLKHHAKFTEKSQVAPQFPDKSSETHKINKSTSPTTNRPNRNSPIPASSDKSKTVNVGNTNASTTNSSSSCPITSELILLFIQTSSGSNSDSVAIKELFDFVVYQNDKKWVLFQETELTLEQIKQRLDTAMVSKKYNSILLELVNHYTQQAIEHLLITGNSKRLVQMASKSQKVSTILLNGGYLEKITLPEHLAVLLKSHIGHLFALRMQYFARERIEKIASFALHKLPKIYNPNLKNLDIVHEMLKSEESYLLGKALLDTCSMENFHAWYVLKESEKDDSTSSVTSLEIVFTTFVEVNPACHAQLAHLFMQDDNPSDKVCHLLDNCEVIDVIGLKSSPVIIEKTRNLKVLQVGFS